MNEQNDFPRRLMACLSDASRYRIALTLKEREMCVTELAGEVGLSQSCTTRHLQALGRDGLVHRRRDGKRVLFRLDDDSARVSALLEWIERGAAPKPPGGAATARDAAGSGATPGDEPQTAPDAAPGSAPAARGESARARRARRTVPGPPRSGRRSGAVPADEPVPQETKPQAPVLRPGDLEDYLL